jgi:hypothetical protein
VTLRRTCRRALLALLTLPLAAAGTVATASAARAVEGVYPTLQCVSYDEAAGELTAHFGYLSANADAVTLFVGSTNYFDPLDADQGQPTVFASGAHPDALTVTWPLSITRTLTWHVLGSSVTASVISPSCSGRFVEEPTLTSVPTVGHDLTVDSGQFLPQGATTYDSAPSITWSRDCDTADPTPVGTGSRYAVTAEDAGHRIGASVTWTESEISAELNDRAPVTVTAATACGSDALAGVSPSAVTVPWISGRATPAGALTLTGASWEGTAPITQTVTWERCDARTCVPVGNGDSYTVHPDDVGQQIRATVQATNAWGATWRTTPAVLIEAPLTVAGAHATFTARQHGTVALHAGGGSGSYHWTTTSALPPGLRLGADGHLDGTPSAPGTWTVTARVTSGTGTSAQTASIHVAVTVRPAVATFAQVHLRKGKVGRRFTGTILVTGGAGAIGWTHAGMLPRGLKLRVAQEGRTLTLTGKPRKARTYRFTLTGRDALGRTLTRTFTVVVKR